MATFSGSVGAYPVPVGRVLVDRVGRRVAPEKRKGKVVDRPVDGLVSFRVL